MREWRLWRKRGETWYAATTRDGATVRRSTGNSDRKAAELVVRRWNREEADPSLAPARRISIEDAVRNFLDMNDNRDIAADTRAFYEEKCGHFPRVWAGRYVDEIDATEVDRYVRTRLGDDHVKPHTVHKEMTALRFVLHGAARRGEYPHDVRTVMRTNLSSKYQPRETFLTRAQFDALIGELSSETAALVCFLVATSARRKEAQRAQRSDVDLTGGAVALRGTKTAGSARTVPITTWARPLLERALRDAPGRDVLFGGKAVWPYTSLRAAAKRAGVPYASPSDLRRTCATWLLADRVDRLAVSKVLGHADTTMVERVYGRVSVATLADMVNRPDPSLDQTGAHSVDSMDSVDVSDAEILGVLVGQDGLEPSANGLRVHRQSSDSAAKRGDFAIDVPLVDQLSAAVLLHRAKRAALAGNEAATIGLMRRVCERLSTSPVEGAAS